MRGQKTSGTGLCIVSACMSAAQTRLAGRHVHKTIAQLIRSEELRILLSVESLPK